MFTLMTKIELLKCPPLNIATFIYFYFGLRKITFFIYILHNICIDLLECLDLDSFTEASQHRKLFQFVSVYRSSPPRS